MHTNMRFTALAMLCCAILIQPVIAQEGPKHEQTETVSPPKPKEDTPKKKARRDTPPLPADVPTFRADTSLVMVDVSVLDKHGNPVPNIPQEYFRITEDGVPQEVRTFAQTEAPITVCLVIEFSNRFQQLWSETWHQTLEAAYGFVGALREDDLVAVVAYDMQSEILSDFTTDRSQTHEALQRLRAATFSEANLFDALADTVDRLSDIEGRKAVVLISSGIDTFSKLTFDKTRKIVQNAGVPIYAIGLMQALREWYDARGYLDSIARLDFLQADNQLRTFTKESGGVAFFPRFYGEFSGIFKQILQSLRTQYLVSYTPTNTAKDGKFRKIQVRLIDPATGRDIKVVDEKGKDVKYKIIARPGYNAPREVE